MATPQAYIKTILLLLILKICWCKNNVTNLSFEKALTYLKFYGYLQNETRTSDTSEETLSLNQDVNVANAISLFQEQFGLTINGQLDAETKYAMQQPRCGVQSNSQKLGTNPRKWNKHVIAWYFAGASNFDRIVAGKAFSIWSQHVNLTFLEDGLYPDIIISWQRYKKHKYLRRLNRATCYGEFEAQTLGHGDYPLNDEIVEIHLNRNVSWDKSVTSYIPSEKTSMLYTLLHEIGHNLGLEHVSQRDSLMYAYAYPPYDVTKIDEDTILAAQYLYGPPNSKTNFTNKITIMKQSSKIINKEPITTTTTTTKPILPILTSVSTTSTTPKINVINTIEYSNNTVATAPIDGTKPPKLCEINEVNHYFVRGYELYIFYNKWFWRKELSSNKISNVMSIDDWLKLPGKEFSDGIRGILQKENGDIFLFSNNTAFLLEINSFKLTKVKILPGNCNVIGALNTYTGKKYILCKNDLLLEYSECRNTVIPAPTTITRRFRGIPESITSAFRYTNGMLYFFDKYNTYEYDEFTDMLKRVIDNDIKNFNIHCPLPYILQQIKSLLKNLTLFSM